MWCLCGGAGSEWSLEKELWLTLATKKILTKSSSLSVKSIY